MKIVKEKESRVVIKNPVWFRLFAWIWVAVFGSAFVFGLLMVILESDSNVGYFFAAAGFIFLLGGMWMVSTGTIIIFDKRKGYLILKKGRVPVLFWLKRKRMISKEEAGSAFVFKLEEFDGFVPVTGIKTFFWNLRMYLFFIGEPPSFTWLGPRTQSDYQVKLLTTSGEEVEIYRSYNVEIADRLISRIRDFSTQTEVPEEIIATKKRSAFAVKPSKKKAIIAGVILILAGLIIAPFGILSGLASPIAMLIITPSGIMTIVAGIFAIIRRKWWLALAGAVWATIVPLVFLALYLYDIYDEYGIENNDIFGEVMFGIVIGIGVIAGILAVVFISVSRRMYR